MKILQILPELNAGGVERGTLEIAQALVAAGHRSLVVSNGGRLVPTLEAQGSRHIALAVHRKSLKSLFVVRALRRVFAEEKPDIVHIRSRVPGWITWLALRGMDKATRPHLVSTVHGFNSINAYSKIMTFGERVIAVSASVREYIIGGYPKLDPGVIRVIPRGVELSFYPRGWQPAEAWSTKFRSENPACAGKAVLLLPGRITRLKGHEDFFALIAGLKKAGVAVHGLVVGDTHPKKREYMAELRERAKALGVAGEVSFLGHRSDVREIMAVSDITFSLSQQPEAFGRVAIEALALGKAFVGYDHGGIGELLSQFFPQGQVKLGDQAGLLAVTQEVLRERLVPGPVGEPYALDSMCRSTIAVYQEVVTKP